LGVVHRKEKFPMRRLMTFMLGLALLTTTMNVAQAQRDTKEKDKNKQKKPKGKKTTKPSIAPPAPR
jgi:hypothetical protein